MMRFPSYEKDPNHYESGVNHDSDRNPRQLSSDATGNAAKDGYTTFGRRPRRGREIVDVNKGKGPDDPYPLADDIGYF